MSTATVLFTLAKHVLSIYETKQARKYLDRVIYLEKAYLKEENKDEEKRNHNSMDSIISELLIISMATENFKKQNS